MQIIFNPDGCEAHISNMLMFQFGRTSNFNHLYQHWSVPGSWRIRRDYPGWHSVRDSEVDSLANTYTASGGTSNWLQLHFVDLTKNKLALCQKSKITLLVFCLKELRNYNPRNWLSIEKTFFPFFLFFCNFTWNCKPNSLDLFYYKKKQKGIIVWKMKKKRPIWIWDKLVFLRLVSCRVSCCWVLREECLFLCPLQCQSPFWAAFHQGVFRCQHSATVTAAPALACLHLSKVRPVLCGANKNGYIRRVHVNHHATPE